MYVVIKNQNTAHNMSSGFCIYMNIQATLNSETGRATSFANNRQCSKLVDILAH